MDGKSKAKVRPIVKAIRIPSFTTIIINKWKIKALVTNLRKENKKR